MSVSIMQTGLGILECVPILLSTFKIWYSEGAKNFNEKWKGLLTVSFYSPSYSTFLKVATTILLLTIHSLRHWVSDLLFESIWVISINKWIEMKDNIWLPLLPTVIIPLT